MVDIFPWISFTLISSCDLCLTRLSRPFLDFPVICINWPMSVLISLKRHVPVCRYSVFFYISNHLINFGSCDISINISAWVRVNFWLTSLGNIFRKFFWMFQFIKSQLWWAFCWYDGLTVLEVFTKTMKNSKYRLFNNNILHYITIFWKP